MKAVILAAGAATRLRPLTDHVPKCLLEVGGVPILRRMLEHLAAFAGAPARAIDEVVIVTGYRARQIVDAVAAWRLPLAVQTVHNDAFDRTNNGSSTLLARPHVDGRAFVLMDSDIVCDRDVLAAVLDCPRADCLALRPATAPGALGAEEMKVVLDPRGRVAWCAKDVDPRVAAGESLGINRFSPAASARFFATLDERVRERGLVNEYNDAAVQQMIEADGYELWPVDIGAHYATEIDTPEDLRTADAELRRRQSFTSPCASLTAL
ncbi:MAG TPA: phosphocholine cytidylyltransferase family protein [Kofleriaceae bacterium]|nr:phosphocholine cytidylyltransferase family protein [Kofleriaceae bacterium]